MSVAATTLLPGCANQAFGEPERATLTQLAKDLFPHPILSDAPYRAIVDAAFPADSDPASLQVARAAVRKLDPDGGSWKSLPPDGRKQALLPLLGEPFFLGFRFIVLSGLYSDLSVTSRFGYQGPSFEQGGYLTRGFDDLPWLSAPSGLEASAWPI